MRRALIFLVVLAAGGFCAVALADTLATVSVCATTPAQTISDNGSPISTVPASTSCSTVTYTVPTVTQTVTVTQPTTTTAAAPTYDSEISYTQNHPAFTPTRTVNVSTAGQLSSALSNLQAGDLVKATAAFTVTGETTLNKALTGHAELDLTGVSFVYSGGSNLPAVYLNGASNLYIYGGDLSTSDTGGTCLLDHGGSQILWWGFTVHDCGGSGVGVFNATAVDHLDLQGEITKVGQNLSYDPHCSLECGTGEHGAILWDAGNTTAFTNSRFAFYAHDIPTGSCVEIGNAAVGTATGNTLYLKCVNATKVATKQAAGDGLDIWGDTSTLGLDVPYIEVDNAQGRAIDASDTYSGQNTNGVTVDYGIASNTNQNTQLNEPSNTLPWYPTSLTPAAP